MSKSTLLIWVSLVAVSLGLQTTSFAQESATESLSDSTDKPQIVTFTTQQDHQT